MSTAFASFIAQTGALCPIGRGIDQIDASVRTGLARFRESPVHDRRFEPVRLSLIPEDQLAPLAPELETQGFTSRQRRMLRLAAPALLEALAGLPPGEPPPAAFIGLPEPRINAPIPLAPAKFFQALNTQASAAIDVSATNRASAAFDVNASQLFPAGRAAALIALAHAHQHLVQRRANYALVGGVDTFLDLALLAELDLEERILGPRVMDGFIPGEGAAFILLSVHRPSAAPLSNPHDRSDVAILGTGTASDPGHRYSQQPALGEGISNAIEQLLSTPQLNLAPASILDVYAGLNGESFQGKEWGVARLRHAPLFAPNSRTHHPADCYGDCGAATGALLLALAHRNLIRNAAHGSSGAALVWASSDREERGCAVVGSLR